MDAGLLKKDDAALLSGDTISTSTLRIGFSEYLNQNHTEEDFVQCHESVAVNIRSID